MPRVTVTTPSSPAFSVQKKHLSSFRRPDFYDEEGEEEDSLCRSLTDVTTY